MIACDRHSVKVQQQHQRYFKLCLDTSILVQGNLHPHVLRLCLHQVSQEGRLAEVEEG